MADTLQTGIKCIDNEFAGFPLRRTIVVLGPPHCGKRPFCQQVLHRALSKGMGIVYTTWVLPPDEIRSSLSDLGSFDEYRLRVIDCTYFRASTVVTRKEKYTLESPYDLSQLLRLVLQTISDLSKEKMRTVLVLDSLSSLLLYNDDLTVTRFVDSLTSWTRELDLSTFILLEEGCHDEKFTNTVRYLSDGVLEFRIDESEKGPERKLRISVLKGVPYPRRWFCFDVKRGRIVGK